MKRLVDRVRRLERLATPARPRQADVECDVERLFRGSGNFSEAAGGASTVERQHIVDEINRLFADPVE